MLAVVSLRSWNTRWLSCSSDSPAAVMRMRRPTRRNTGSLSSSSSSRICRLIADCETWSLWPAAVNDPVSAMARMISSCRRSTIPSENASEDISRREMDSRGTMPRAGDRFLEIVLVELDAGEIDPEFCAGDRRTAEAQEWIDGKTDPLHAVQLEAVGRQAPRERRRVRALLVAALDGVVGQEPGVAAAAHARSGPLP